MVVEKYEAIWSLACWNGDCDMVARGSLQPMPVRLARFSPKPGDGGAAAICCNHRREGG